MKCSNWAELETRSYVLSCICLWVCDKNVRLSAKSRSSSCIHVVYWMLFILCSVVVFIFQPIAREQRKGKFHPCLIPVLNSMGSVRCPLHAIPLYEFLMVWWYLSFWFALHSVAEASRNYSCQHCRRPSHNQKNSSYVQWSVGCSIMMRNYETSLISD